MSHLNLRRIGYPLPFIADAPLQAHARLHNTDPAHLAGTMRHATRTLIPSWGYIAPLPANALLNVDAGIARAGRL